MKRHQHIVFIQLGIIAMLVSVCALTGCDMFDYHPYDARFKGETHINFKQKQRIESLTSGHDTICFAMISDNHLNYRHLERIIDHLNTRTDIQFVIHGGDITDNGTTREYETIRHIMGKLEHPCVVIMGNHDCLGSGIETFQAMYGPANFSFIAGKVKFVCLDTNALEYNYVAPIPNFSFMEEEAKNNTDKFNKTVIVMHASPGNEVFNNNVMTAFSYYTHLFPNLQFCLHGHNHATEQEDIYNDGIIYYGAPAALNKAFLLFTIYPDRYEYEEVKV